MWTARREELPDGRGLRFALDRDSRLATFTDVVHAWRSNEAFRTTFNSLLAEAPYSAFRWETPPVTRENSSRPFEFVLLNSPGLARTPDPEAFADHFVEAEGGVASFSNLGGDAILIVPCPFADHATYRHLAAFVRLAPEEQRHALWRAVGEAMERRLSAEPVWLSTAGAGVSWLH
ncbi:MAG: hypothetical protein KY475_17115, partial [Planctomycetes bacterium]|nr:hypothetical protein [Planctomycetota bacterium]